MKTRYAGQLGNTDNCGGFDGTWDTLFETTSLKEAKRRFPALRRRFKTYRTRLVRITETTIPMPR